MELIESQEGGNRVEEAWDLCRKTKVTPLQADIYARPKDPEGGGQQRWRKPSKQGRQHVSN